MSETLVAAAEPTAARTRALAAATRHTLDTVSECAWQRLCGEAAEPNAFYAPGFTVPAAAFAQGGHGADALCVEDGERLIGFLPVTSALRAYGLPIPALVGTVPYAVLGSPLLVPDRAAFAAGRLLDAAAATGARLLVLPKLDLDGPAMAGLAAAAERRGLTALIHGEHQRAALAVPDDAETYLRAGMGAKKLKELRRQGHRLDEEGTVAFASAHSPDAVAPALTRFLELEARGWKGKRGTGLGQSEGDTRFIRTAATTLASKGDFEVLEMTLDGRPIASGLIIRQQNTALFFKIAYDEAYARFSPGVQLTVELTRRLVEDPAITYADSTALPGHPMIDHVWRERRRVGDVLIPTRPGIAGPALARLVIARHRARDEAKHLVHAFKKFREKSR
ncbi:MAG TPA: GNAT family N-acetyltransferase [Devosiaceae bacterium]|jgi:CelD/BcsL family acetyltransferase involved in cellulose biosynthesis